MGSIVSVKAAWARSASICKGRIAKPMASGVTTKLTSGIAMALASSETSENC